MYHWLAYCYGLAIETVEIVAVVSCSRWNGHGMKRYKDNTFYSSALAACFFVVSILFADSSVVAQQTQIDLSPSGSAVTRVTNSTINELLAVQKKVQDVASKNMEATVSLTDDFGLGSGVIVSPDGLILTAAHVVATARNYKVIFPSGREATAKPLGKNLSADAAMLKIIEPGKYPFVELGDSDRINNGEWAVVLGHSGGYELGRKGISQAR